MKYLVESLGSPVSSEREFVSAVLTGELVRRMIPMQDDDVSEAMLALARYDEWLASYNGPVPHGLDGHLAAAFEDLASLDRPDDDEVEDALRRIDGVLAVAAALWRAGRVDQSFPVELGREAARRAAEIAPELPKTWDAAERDRLCLAPDPDLPGLYCFLDEFAAFSYERLLTEEAICAGMMANKLDEQNDMAPVFSS